MKQRNGHPVRRYPPVAYPLGSHPGPAILQAIQLQGNLGRHLRSRPGGRAAQGNPGPADGSDGLSGSAERAGGLFDGGGDRGRRIRDRRLQCLCASAATSRAPRWATGWPHLDGGRQLAYVTDNELGPGGNYEVTPDWRSRMVQFLQGADTLIHDAMYLDQIIQARAGWGHSTPRQAVDLARGRPLSPADPVPSRAGAR